MQVFFSLCGIVYLLTLGAIGCALLSSRGRAGEVAARRPSRFVIATTVTAAFTLFTLTMMSGA